MEINIDRSGAQMVQMKFQHTLRERNLNTCFHSNFFSWKCWAAGSREKKTFIIESVHEIEFQKEKTSQRWDSKRERLKRKKSTCGVRCALLADTKAKKKKKVSIDSMGETEIQNSKFISFSSDGSNTTQKVGSLCQQKWEENGKDLLHEISSPFISFSSSLLLTDCYMCFHLN